MDRVNLPDLVYSEGYGFVVDPDPRSHNVLGDPPPDLTAACLCEDPQGNRYMTCITDTFDHVYACAHEIAEDREGHAHTERMLTEQAHILTRWCLQLADQQARSM